MDEWSEYLAELEAFQRENELNEQDELEGFWFVRNYSQDWRELRLRSGGSDKGETG